MAKKVIIIDDSVTQLNIAKSAFALKNWEVYGAQNAKDAWEMIFDLAPDIIITDAIMPKVGGFRLVKAIRENEIISKIPVIIHSILPKSHAKFYIGQSKLDYFFQKSKDIEKLVVLAQKITQEHPLYEDDKMEILKSSLVKPFEFYNEIKPIEDIFSSQKFDNEVQEADEDAYSLVNVKKNIDFENLEYEFKNIYNFSYSDEKLIGDFFALLYPKLNYDLFMVNFYSFEKSKNLIYFDIRNIILSPVFQKKMIDKYKADDVVLFKNYAPNLKMIVSEEEFFSKIEFSFDYREKQIAQIAFYTKDKAKSFDFLSLDDVDELEKLKRILYNFFKARYVNKNLVVCKNESKLDKYFNSKFEFPKSKTPTYIALVQILNFDKLEEELSDEELDILNLKISQRIIKCLDINEQIYKKAQGKYVVMITALDDKQANHKLNYMINSLFSIENGEFDLEIGIGASNCLINDVFDVVEAQKNAEFALDFVNKEEKVVIKNGRNTNSDTEE